MQQEESCSSLLPELGGSNGGCACPAIGVKAFGTCSIPGHSEISGCYSEGSTSCCQSQKCKPWHLRAEHLGMLQTELHGSAEEISAAAESGQVFVCSATMFFISGTIQSLISTSMTSCITQNLSGGNPNTTIHTIAMKSSSPSLPNNARALFGPSVLLFLTGEALSIFEIVWGTSLYRDIPQLHWMEIWTGTHHF